MLDRTENPASSDTPSFVRDGISRRLAAAAANFPADALPDSVGSVVRLFVLDTLGVIAGGAKAPGIRELAQALRAMEPQGGISMALVGGFTASPVTAALMNGAAAHALDFDDTHDAARVHAFSVVLPAALAAAEIKGGADGRTFLAAVAIGSEVFCRLGLAGFNTLATGWHPTTGYGALAAAVAAGRIFGLHAEQMTNALGIAYVQMSGTTQSVADGALTKRLGPGIAARNGLTAAQLAHHGLTGPGRYLEGEAGLFHLHLRDEVRPEALTDGFGERWDLLDLSMKPFPCCRCSHTLIQIGIELNARGMKATDIASGRLLLGAVNHGVVGAPYDRAHASPVVHAQFNATYAFCRALADGAVGLSTFSLDGVRSFSDLLPQRLRCEIADDVAADALAPARVELTLADGSTLKLVRDTMKGAPDEPMTHEEVLAKFATNLAWGLDTDREQAARIADCVTTLEKLHDVRELSAIFRAGSAA
jgi:2-methylcitrate dehydratase PrpD